MSQRHTCPDAVAVLSSSHEDMAGPKEQPLRFVASVEPDGSWRVEQSDFGDGGFVQLEDVTTPFGQLPLTVSLDGPARGRWQADGEMWIEVPFVFSIRAPFGVLTSYATLGLDTAIHRLDETGAEQSGRRYDNGSGQLTLAGAGVFDGGPLDGVQLLIGLRGHLQPAALG